MKNTRKIGLILSLCGMLFSVGIVAEDNNEYSSNSTKYTNSKTLPFKGERLDAAAAVRHQRCVQSLGEYFTDKASHESMQVFLIVQYDITMAKVFGALLGQRLNNRRDGNDDINSYTQLVKQAMIKMEQMSKGDPKFLEAKKTYESAPLSIQAYAKLAPYFYNYLLQNTEVYDHDPVSYFRLDNNDFRMLDVMASLERRQLMEAKNDDNIHPEMFMMRQIEDLTANKISDRNALANIYLFKTERVLPRERQLEETLRKMPLPAECADERRDVAKALNYPAWIKQYDDSIYSLTQINDDVAQALFDSLLKRKDLKKAERDEMSQLMYYVGKGSPWGDYDK